MTRYRATRSLHYIDKDGQDRIVHEGDFVANASDGKIQELLADGFVKESRSSKNEGDDK